MSAFMVSKIHIDLLIRVALDGPRDNHKPGGYGQRRWYAPRLTYNEGELRYERANAAGEMLIKENLSSIHARYPDTIENPEGTPGPIDQYWLKEYVYERPARHLTAVEAFKAISCYEYQACEHPEWETSHAHRFCQEFRECLIGTLPGYEDAQWEYSEDTVQL